MYGFFKFTASGFHVLECDLMQQLKETNFIENCLDILVDFCNNREFIHTFEPNVSLSLLERRSELEVRAQKCEGVRVSASGSPGGRARPPPSAALLASAADALHNLAGFASCPIQEWNERGLYRLLFRCASWCGGPRRSVWRVRGAACAALRALRAPHGPRARPRAASTATDDCLHDLLLTLTPFEEDDKEKECLSARAHALNLVASLLGERGSANSVWRLIKDGDVSQLLHLLLQCLESDEIELQDAGLYCLTQLAQSAANKKHSDKSADESCVGLLEGVDGGFWAGAGGGRCRPARALESLCGALIHLYHAMQLADNGYHTSEDGRWARVCSCLSSVLAASPCSRLYAVHRQLPRALLAALHAVRDQLSLHGKPADVIRNADNNPVLHTLYWLLTVIDCSMVECAPAKECYAEDMAASLCRLWPWCMMNERLRHAVIHLLYTFNNNCPKAWSSMCVCVCGCTLAGCACALVSREAALQSRPRPAALLVLALRTLRALVDHHHCRAILLKSEALPSMYKLCARSRVRGAGGGAGLAEWARLCAALARHADGGGAVLAQFAGGSGGSGGGVPLGALPGPARARLLPALAHAAPAHRTLCLQSPELLELLSGTLLAGDIAEMVSAARAVWGLAANNHKAKLVLRSAGVAAAVHSALQRLQRARHAPHDQHAQHDPAAQRALQLLVYTHAVLQTT